MLLPSCSSDHACSLPKDEGACFIVLLRQWRENLPYVLYTEAAEETANRFDSREHCQTVCLGQ